MSPVGTTEACLRETLSKMDDLEQRALAFVVRQLAKDVSIESTLLGDLGCDGDDAVGLFQKFGKEFEVDLGPLYEFWHRHFNAEGRGAQTSQNWLVPISVADLVKAARTKRWPEEPIRYERPLFSVEL